MTEGHKEKIKEDYFEEQKKKLELLSNNIIPLRPDLGYYITVNGIDVSKLIFSEEYENILKSLNSVINKIKES